MIRDQVPFLCSFLNCCFRVCVNLRLGTFLGPNGRSILSTMTQCPGGALYPHVTQKTLENGHCGQVIRPPVFTGQTGQAPLLSYHWGTEKERGPVQPHPWSGEQGWMIQILWDRVGEEGVVGRRCQAAGLPVCGQESRSPGTCLGRRVLRRSGESRRTEGQECSRSSPARRAAV